MPSSTNATGHRIKDWRVWDRDQDLHDSKNLVLNEPRAWLSDSSHRKAEFKRVHNPRRRARRGKKKKNPTKQNKTQHLCRRSKALIVLNERYGGGRGRFTEAA